MTSTVKDSVDDSDKTSLPYLATHARLPAICGAGHGEGPELLARIRATAELARLLDDLDLRAEQPTITFEPDRS